MANRPALELQSAADLLAGHLARHGGARTLELMSHLGLLAVQDESPAEPAMDGQKRVGIWIECEDGGHFVRMATTTTRWSRAPAWPPKRSARRVVLLGESAARGFFYDPDYNCAHVLESILRCRAGAAGVEVIDLACTGMLFDGLIALVDEALLLQPDALVIFAGNNWHERPLDDLDVQGRLTLARELRDGVGWTAVRRAAEAQYRLLAGAFLDRLEETHRTERIPITFVVPEFNLNDWRYAGERAAGHHQLAGAALARGDAAGARAHLEAARDTEAWSSPTPLAPRTCSVTQQLLRERAGEHSVVLVDLPRVFERYLDGALPDRRLFLDHCHLTAEGIRVAMAAAAEPMVRSLFGANVGWQDMIDDAPEPHPSIAGRAHLLAAAHNESRGQAREILEHHCREAVRLWPDLVASMGHAADFLSRRASPLACGSFHDLDPLCERLADSAPGLHQILVDCLVAATSEQLPRLAQSVQEIRAEEHGVERWTVDLLEPWSASPGSIASWGRQRRFHQALGAESVFVLVADGPCDLDVECVHRLPGGAGTIQIVLNGIEIGSRTASSNWTCWRLRAPREYVRRGINELRVVWPPQPDRDDRAIMAVIDALERGAPVEVHAPAGQIHTFTATASDRSRAPAG
jgi:hypothetical protein